jgi:hypothetical protein
MKNLEMSKMPKTKKKLMFFVLVGLLMMVSQTFAGFFKGDINW